MLWAARVCVPVTSCPWRSTPETPSVRSLSIWRAGSDGGCCVSRVSVSCITNSFPFSLYSFFIRLAFLSLLSVYWDVYSVRHSIVRVILLYLHSCCICTYHKKWVPNFLGLQHLKLSIQCLKYVVWRWCLILNYKRYEENRKWNKVQQRNLRQF